MKEYILTYFDNNGLMQKACIEAETEAKAIMVAKKELEGFFEIKNVKELIERSYE